MNGGERMKGQEKRIVLVVETDTKRRFMTSVYLLRLGYHVFSVGSAEEAMQVLQLADPLVLITGPDLPGISGIALLQGIKEDLRTRALPVIVYAASIDPALRKAFVEAGCADCVTHSVDQNRLYEAVQQATEARPRHFVRLATLLDVAVGEDAGPENPRSRARITALSERGMFVALPEAQPFGKTLPFTFALPNAQGRTIRLEGRVLYSNAGGDGKLSGMGITFTKIRPEDQELIRSYLGGLLTEGIAKQ